MAPKLNFLQKTQKYSESGSPAVKNGFVAGRTVGIPSNFDNHAGMATEVLQNHPPRSYIQAQPLVFSTSTL